MPAAPTGNFRVLVLRQGATIVTAATIRFFGIKFAEMPFVATKEGYRRSGNCKRLMRVRLQLPRSCKKHSFLIKVRHGLLESSGGV